MSGALLVITFLAAVNPARVRLGVPETGSARARPAVLGGGTLLGLGVVWALAAVSGPLLDWLEVTPETFRIAAGITAVLAAAVVLVSPRPADEPELPGWRAALWPVAFPRLAAPQVLVLAISTGAQEGVAATLGAAAVSLGVLGVFGLVPRRGVTDRALLWLGRVLAALLVVAAIGLIIEGIREV